MAKLLEDLAGRGKGGFHKEVVIHWQSSFRITHLLPAAPQLRYYAGRFAVCQSAPKILKNHIVNRLGNAHHPHVIALFSRPAPDLIGVVHAQPPGGTPRPFPR
jgi:hypothetical protein